MFNLITSHTLFAIYRSSSRKLYQKSLKYVSWQKAKNISAYWHVMCTYRIFVNYKYVFCNSTQYIDKRLAHAVMSIYTCQFTYQLILVQDIDECHQKAFPGAPTAVKTSEQLLGSCLEVQRL